MALFLPLRQTRQEDGSSRQLASLHLHIVNEKKLSPIADLRVVPVILSRLRRSLPPKDWNTSLVEKVVLVISRWLTLQELRQFDKNGNSAWACGSSFSTSWSGVSESTYYSFDCSNWVLPMTLPSKLNPVFGRQLLFGNMERSASNRINMA